MWGTVINVRFPKADFTCTKMIEYLKLWKLDLSYCTVEFTKELIILHRFEGKVDSITMHGTVAYYHSDEVREHNSYGKSQTYYYIFDRKIFNTIDKVYTWIDTYDKELQFVVYVDETHALATNNKIRKNGQKKMTMNYAIGRYKKYILGDKVMMFT